MVVYQLVFRVDCVLLNAHSDCASAGFSLCKYWVCCIHSAARGLCCERDHLCLCSCMWRMIFRMGLPEICKPESASQVKAAKSVQLVIWPIWLLCHSGNSTPSSHPSTAIFHLFIIIPVVLYYQRLSSRTVNAASSSSLVCCWLIGTVGTTQKQGLINHLTHW